MKKEYEGTAYIGVVGPDNEPGEARDSIERILRRPGDEGPFFNRATKGYEARQAHLNNFVDTHHDFMMLLDHDQIFQQDCLERLRRHKLPYVSGLYMRRQIQPIAPVWYRPYNGQWPLEPFVGQIERGKLHKLGASGWGCVLVHREVILEVRAMLYGEWEILEDDMDIWPYDLSKIMGAIRGLRSLIEEKPGISTLHATLEAHTKALEEQIRPLRADREQVGSDIRFPFFALHQGYQLWGDPDVRCGHILDYALTPNDWDGIPPEMLAEFHKNTHKKVTDDRKRIKMQKEALING